MTACLMLHGIGPTPPHICDEEKPYWITEGTFAGLLEMLRETKARLTFDDGNDTDATIALPMLQAAGMSAAFFVISDRIGTSGYLSEDQIRLLYGAGMEIGSHGCAHIHWTKTSDVEIAIDVARSIERLSAIIKAPVRTVAVPFGDCDRRVLAVLRKLGIGRVYTSFRGPEMGNAWLVRRDCIMAHMTRADIKAVLSRKRDLADTALDFLRVWRRAGNAVLWEA